MIPKTIHYCWFGRNPKPDIVLRCIESWKRYCSGFEIIEWNEEIFDLSECQYAQDAYDERKWAFVSDYVRIKVLLEYGGVYMDTDVEIIRPLDDLLQNEAFIGFEKGLDNQYGVNTGSMMGATPGNEFLRIQEEAYRKYAFRNKEHLNLTTCVEYSTDIMTSYGLQRNNQRQKILGVEIYPSDYFCPLDMKTGKISTTNNTYSIHRYAGTWASSIDQYGYHLKWDCIAKYGRIIGKMIYGVRYTVYIIKNDGLIALVAKIKGKIDRKK